jgi:CRP-like cAMP-binding protein
METTLVLGLGGLLLAVTLFSAQSSWVRSLCAAALAFGTAALVAELLQVSWVVIIWLAILVLVNGAGLAAAAFDRMGMRLNERESTLLRGPFSGVPAKAFRRLLDAGRWHSIPAGTPVTIEGEPVDDLMVLGQGSARVEVAGRQVAVLKPGSFIGEMSLLTQGNATATVTPTESCWLFSIPKRDLLRLCEQDRQFDAALHTVLSRDLVKKLIALRQRSQPAMA